MKSISANSKYAQLQLPLKQNLVLSVAQSKQHKFEKQRNLAISYIGRVPSNTVSRARSCVLPSSCKSMDSEFPALQTTFRIFKKELNTSRDPAKDIIIPRGVMASESPITPFLSQPPSVLSTKMWISENDLKHIEFVENKFNKASISNSFASRPALLSEIVDKVVKDQASVAEKIAANSQLSDCTCFFNNLLKLGSCKSQQCYIYLGPALQERMRLYKSFMLYSSLVDYYKSDETSANAFKNVLEILIGDYSLLAQWHKDIFGDSCCKCEKQHIPNLVDTNQPKQTDVSSVKQGKGKNDGSRKNRNKSQNSEVSEPNSENKVCDDEVPFVDDDFAMKSVSNPFEASVVDHLTAVTLQLLVNEKTLRILSEAVYLIYYHTVRGCTLARLALCAFVSAAFKSPILFHFYSIFLDHQDFVGSNTLDFIVNDFQSTINLMETTCLQQVQDVKQNNRNNAKDRLSIIFFLATVYLLQLNDQTALYVAQKITGMIENFTSKHGWLEKVDPLFSKLLISKIFVVIISALFSRNYEKSLFVNDHQSPTQNLLKYCSIVNAISSVIAHECAFQLYRIHDWYNKSFLQIFSSASAFKELECYVKTIDQYFELIGIQKLYLEELTYVQSPSQIKVNDSVNNAVSEIYDTMSSYDIIDSLICDLESVLKQP